MPLLDIDSVISSKEVGSRFRLVNLASRRARELNSPVETTLSQQSVEFCKVTTNALNEIICNKITFEDDLQEGV
ncbi:MAG: DNA-directed RNA polymerase subunit omega [Deferribacteraceae bacterium]|jgi:DNA-directed RNA polymerase omega subunit|nr:DNA-directed RNA polymerase subunit omega [Deferribacteraceae bacterium]